MSSRKIGLGMYPGLLTTENFRFAQQAGATHIIAHLPGFARRESRGLPPEREAHEAGGVLRNLSSKPVLRPPGTSPKGSGAIVPQGYLDPA